MIAKRLSILLFTFLMSFSSVYAADFKPVKGQTAVRVCADAYNLPYSNKKLEGFDNRIAALIGEELGIPVEYYWFPQRIGFTRNTIKKVDPKTGRFMCDLAMSMPASPGRLAVTTPYFESIDVMVYRTGEGYELNEISDIVAARTKEGKKLRIGLFDRALATEKIINLGLAEQVEYFQFMAGDTRVYPGRIVEDALASGQIDVAFAWGPVGGYYASQSKVAMKVMPLNEFGDRYIFNFALGVRHQDKGWKALLNQIMEKRKDDIAAIIAEYNFPSLENVAVSGKKQMVTKADD